VVLCGFGNVKTGESDSKMTNKIRKDQTIVCPESTIDSAPRRNFVKRAALTAAGVALGASVLSGKALPNVSAKTDYCSYCNIFVWENNRINSNDNNNGTLQPGLIFGSGGTGEGISSARLSGSVNQFGLDFYTAFTKRLSITHCGNVGIGTATPSHKLCVNGTISATANVIGYCNGQGLGGASGSSEDCYGVLGVTCTGAGVRAVSGGPCGGLYSETFRTIPAVFENTAGSGDRSALIQLEAGPSSSLADWNLGAAGSNNGCGVVDGEFYIQQVGKGERFLIDNCGVIYADPKCGNTGTLHPGPSITFGGLGSGEGIASNRHSCQPNQFGLCFYTDSPPSSPKSSRMSITNTGNVGIGTKTPGTTLQVVGGFSSKVATVTANYKMAATDFGVLANASSKAFKVTLPPASTANGMLVFVNKIDSSANVVTVKTSGTDKIEGKASEKLSKEYAGMTLIADGNTPGNWYIVTSQN
jgi:hypothetical protein